MTFMLSQLSGSKPADQDSSVDLPNLNTLPLHLSQMEKMAAIGQLSSSVAHEMRNLLGMIHTAAFNIDRAVNKNDPTVNNNLEIINRSVRRAREFIDNLLNLSSVPRGREEILDVAEVVECLLNLFSKELEWHNIQLKRNYARLPRVRIDCHALQECLLNLILNAIQSMDNGGTISIEIRSFQRGVRIIIEDTGCGIPQENLERIFDKFYTTKKHNQGTGLGLTIARSLAQQLGGDITVDSQVDQGSRFTLSLPSLIPASSLTNADESAAPPKRKVI
ncbi:MAG: HAMP domain-containing histidine kinase [Candidatus Omnitrophica bacterium]|nr:HAMP domain-containing histidine kinase [Candidatus Omnitrophota bacterium]